MGCDTYSALLGTLQNAGSPPCSLACLISVMAQQRFVVIQVTLSVTVVLLLLHAAL